MKRILLALLLALTSAAASAQWPGYIDKPSGGSGDLTIGTTAITGGATTQVLYNLAGVVSSSANLTYSDTGSVASGPRLVLGSGSAGTQGFVFGTSASGQSSIWSTATTATSSNFIFRASGGAAPFLSLQAGTGSAIIFYAGEGDEKARFTSGAGRGLDITAGTATTDVAALSVTRSNNNAAVATGVKFTFTDTTSASTFKPLEILCGSAATSNCLTVDKSGRISTDYNAGNTAYAVLVSGQNPVGWGRNGSVNGFNIWGGDQATPSDSNATVNFRTALFQSHSGVVHGWSSSSSVTASADTGLSRVSAGVVGVGTGAAGSTAGTLSAATFSAGTDYQMSGNGSYKVETKAMIRAQPTIASGGCTSPTVTNTNGTAHFTIDVGTGCSGSQPIVFTLAAATNGWNCYARNVTNGATSAPAQTGAVSTTSVTITNFARTTGVAAAWTDGDDVVVSCLGG